jgi:hypothetical protein
LRAMGLEAKCGARWGKKTSAEGKAHLDADKLDYWGTFKVAIPFREMRDVEVKKGELVLAWDGVPFALALGSAEAAKWAQKIKYPRGRLDKLGVKPGAAVTLLGVADADFRRELGERDAQVSEKPRKDQDAIFFAVNAPGDLGKLTSLQGFLKPAGAIWVVRRKGKEVTVTEKQVMDAARAQGLVDVKVVSFSDTHTAEKLVIPVARRQ